MKNLIFVLFPLKSTGWVDFWRDILTPLNVVPQIFFAKMTAKDELTNTYKRLVKYLGVLVQSEKKSIGIPLVRLGLISILMWILFSIIKLLVI